MAVYNYQAINASGRTKKGLLEADTPKQVRKKLRDMGMIPVAVDAVTDKTDSQQRSSALLSYKRGIRVTELALLTRQLATLVQAGLPLDEALTAVAQQSDKQHIKSIVLAVRAGVLEGNTLADSLAMFPQVFNTLYCSMVAAGESSGHLAEVLVRLADYTEQRQALRQKTMLALLYPGILTCVAIAVVAALLAFVVPKVVMQFTTVGQSLPLATQLLIGISDAVRDYGVICLIILAGLAISILWLLKRPVLRYRFDQILLSLPVINKVVLGLNTARFSRTLSILTSSGVPLLESLQISGKVLANSYLQASVKQSADHVKEGSSLFRALSEPGHFPPMMLHMIANGENSGELDQMLSRVADNQERELEGIIAIALGLFEPLLILLMGGVVLFIVIAILLPIFELNSLVS